jgi:multidrug efflux pump subunit AcrB
MFSRFFIDRPIFAAVLSIVITLAGVLAASTLPLAQFPRVTPPTIQVQATYPGASAQDVAEAVAAPIEQEVNGVEGMMYMSSQSTNDGQYNLTVTFFQDVDLNMAQVLVQNRVSLAMPKLPDVIKATGVTTRKRSPDILMGYAIVSPKRRYDQLYLSNYALRAIKDEISRVPGVADVFLFGQMDYSMRIWLDPERLAERNLSATDVVKAIQEQNAQVATGQFGQRPAPTGQMTQTTLNTLGRLTETEQFENIVLRVTPDGRSVRLKDMARVELGAKTEDVVTRFDGHGNAFVAIFQRPDANALETAERVIAKMEDLKRSFPEDVDFATAFDTTPYTRESIHEVANTLRDAIILVALVVLVFLQNWRSAIIPLIAVPVAIIGTFAVMKVVGFSLNNLTLFGLVLAIGIVVDDAIVVVEAVEHHIERGLKPREATIEAMHQVSGPVIAVGLVLSAVFLPCTVISGITGQFFRQFALTIAASTIISTFNSLTLSPALTALLLRPRGAKAAPPLPRAGFLIIGPVLVYLFGFPLLDRWDPSAPIYWSVAAGAAVVVAVAGWFAGPACNRLLGWAFHKFNAGFNAATGRYARLIGKLFRVRYAVLGAYVFLLALTYFAFSHTPRGFIPSQDMGYLMVSVQLPDAASRERTDAVMKKIEKIVSASPGVAHCTWISGQSFALQANGSNFGSMFINLDQYGKRRDPYLHSEKIAFRLREDLSAIPEAQVAVFTPPPVRGVGRAGGFTLVVEDRGDLGLEDLQEYTDNLVRTGNETEGLAGLFSVFRANVPQLNIEPDKAECMTKGVSLADFALTQQAYMGSLYINDFNLFGRTYQVIIQADAPYRDQPDDISRYKVRNVRGGMVPLGSVATIKPVKGPLMLARYNMYPAAVINGMSAEGTSSGEAIDIVRELADKELPVAMGIEWSDMSYLELMAGNTAMAIFAFAVVMVFLVLAALYESWSLPLAVILVVPMCLLSAITGVNIASMDINIFTQVGFVVLVGLASKNAILIVEFAKKQRAAGVPRTDATLEACRLRLRPIIMTSLAFILGVLPLVVATGAGAEMRQALGTAVFSGMIGVTLFGILLTPVFFYVVDWASHTPIFASQAAHAFTVVLLPFSPMFHWRTTVPAGVKLLKRVFGIREAGSPSSNGEE